MPDTYDYNKSAVDEAYDDLLQLVKDELSAPSSFKSSNLSSEKLRGLIQWLEHQLKDR